ncbi:hypothetical protein O988_06447 [Pseudogymnoascus sp. VKM F-3808]|nr:hypothetical protein O988_06447 [Pseudogymnoascus sp. VKM F-3808]
MHFFNISLVVAAALTMSKADGDVPNVAIIYFTKDCSNRPYFGVEMSEDEGECVTLDENMRSMSLSLRDMNSELRCSLYPIAKAQDEYTGYIDVYSKEHCFELQETVDINYDESRCVTIGDNEGIQVTLDNKRSPGLRCAGYPDKHCNPENNPATIYEAVQPVVGCGAAGAISWSRAKSFMSSSGFRHSQ